MLQDNTDIIDNTGEVLQDPIIFEGILGDYSFRDARAWEIRNYQLLNNLYIFNSFEENPITTFGAMEPSISARLPEIRDLHLPLRVPYDSFITVQELKKTLLVEGHCSGCLKENCLFCQKLSTKDPQEANKALLHIIYTHTPVPSEITGEIPSPADLAQVYEQLFTTTYLERVAHTLADPKLRPLEDLPKPTYYKEASPSLYQGFIEATKSLLIKHVFFINKDSFSLNI